MDNLLATNAQVDQKISEGIKEYKNISSAIGSENNGKIFETPADAIAVDPKPANGIRFFIRTGNATYAAGEYSWQSAESDGIRFEKEIIDSTFFSYKKSDNQLFDKKEGWENGGFSSGNTNQSTEGAERTKYINIPESESKLSFFGLGFSIARRIAWMTGIDGAGDLISVNTTNSSEGIFDIPSNAKSFRFFYKRSEDGNVRDSLMLYFGTENLAYDDYRKISEINKTKIALPQKKIIKSISASLNGVSPNVNTSGWYKATPVVEDVILKGNTGLGYDLNRGLFLVSEYNSDISSRLLIFRNADLIERNTDNPQISTPFKTIDFTSIIDHIQGCAWDQTDDSYLVMGTKKGEETGANNTLVIKCTPYGTILNVFELGDDLTVQVGMIDVLIDGNIGIKPNTGSTLYIFDRSYNLLDRKHLTSSEGFCVNKFTGEIWCANEANEVFKFDSAFNEITTYYYNTFDNENGQSNIEGMCILPDGSLVVSADCFLHGATQLGNSLFFFDFENTVNKKKFFYLPKGIGNFKNVQKNYVTEIINAENLQDVNVVSNFDAKVSYRSGATKASIAYSEFSNILNSDNYIQLKIRN